jgi:hypothetical protein
MSDLEKTGKSNSFIRLWLRCVASSQVNSVSAAQSNSQQFSHLSPFLFNGGFLIFFSLLSRGHFIVLLVELNGPRDIF